MENNLYYRVKNNLLDEQEKLKDEKDGKFDEEKQKAQFELEQACEDAWWEEYYEHY